MLVSATRDRKRYRCRPWRAAYKRWAVAPAAAGGQDVQDAGDDAAVVLTFLPGRIAQHERLDDRPLRVREPKHVHHRYSWAANRGKRATKPQREQHLGLVQTQGGVSP